MPDLSGLGDLVLTVGGDITPLTSALDAIPAVAQQTSREIQAAFDALPSATEGIEQNLVNLSTAITDAGNSASNAAPKIDEVPPALHNVESAAHDSEVGLHGMAEQLVALGEALVVTEALREFGQEALTTYGNVQKVEISLTALTGSAQKSEEMISKLKDLALSDALSFPTLAAAAQKMTALGFSAEQTQKALRTAADSAAATGNDFGAVANKFDLIVSSGAVASRSLVALGINMQALADVMGVSAGKVTKEFKTLTETERFDILTTALQKFGGTAEQVAQGISGQFQNMKTSIEFVMEDVGKALAPVASQFIGFVNDLLPGIHSLVDGFTSLPEPIKDMTIALVAAVPLVAGIAIAVGTFGTQLAAALDVLIPVTAAIAGIAGAIALIHFSGVTDDFMNMVSAIRDNIPGISDLFSGLGPVIDGVKGYVASLVASLDDLTGGRISAGIKDISAAFDGLGLSVSKIIGMLTGPIGALKEMFKAIGDLAEFMGGKYKTMGDAVTKAAGDLSKASDDLNHKIATQTGGFGDAEQAGSKYVSALQRTIDAHVKVAASATDSADATDKMTKAQLKAMEAAVQFQGPIYQANLGIEMYSGATKDATDRTSVMSNGIEILNGKVSTIKDTFDAARVKIVGFSDAMKLAITDAASFTAHLNAIANAATSAVGPIQAAGAAAMAAAHGNVGSGSLADSVRAGASGFGGQGGSGTIQGNPGDVVTQRNEYGAIISQITLGLDALKQVQANYVAHLQALAAAAKAQTDAAVALQLAAQQQQDAANKAADALKMQNAVSQGMIGATNSLNSSALAAADAANQQAFDNSVFASVMTQVNAVTAGTAQALSIATNTMIGAASVVAQIATKAGVQFFSGTLTPAFGSQLALPNVSSSGPSGAYSPVGMPFAAPAFASGPQSNVTVSVNGSQFVQSLMNEFVRNLQTQGIRLTRG